MATALEESQKRMSLAARAARLSTLVWDVARDKVRATRLPRQPAGERAIAFEEVLESTHVADRDELQRAVTKALATGEEIDVEYRTVAADGEVYWIAARGRAEKGDGQLIGVAIDITERKRAELRALEDRNALRHMTRVSMLGQLSASIAHQLNQPLAAILGNAEAARKMLARERVDLVELREICDDIVTEDNRAAAVIRRLGALYKRGEMKMEPLDLNALIRETLDLLRAELQIRHVTPIIDLAPALPLVDGESVQLQQVVLNLVLNAADAMNRTKVEERHLVIRTEALDEGDSTVRDRQWIRHCHRPSDQCLRRVLDHEARRHGHRACDLPIDRGRASGAHHGQQQPAGRSDVLHDPAARATDMSDAITIFIVDDDPGRAEGPVACAARGGLARRDLRVRGGFLARPGGIVQGCLVLDVTMPGLDGLELQRRLVETGRSLPIVFVSGYGDIPMTVRAMKAGATDFLTKPVPAQVLIAAVRPAIDEDAVTRQTQADTEALRQRLDDADAARARDSRGAGGRQAQQADRRGSRRGRADGQVPSRTDHGTDAGEDHRRAHAYRRARRNRRDRRGQGSRTRQAQPRSRRLTQRLVIRRFATS